MNYNLNHLNSSISTIILKIFFKMHYNYAVFNIQIHMHEKRGQNMKGLKNNLLTYRQWLLSLRGCALQGLFALSMSDWDQANVYCFYGIRVILTVSMVTLILTFLCQQVHAYCLYGNR